MALVRQKAHAAAERRRRQVAVATLSVLLLVAAGHRRGPHRAPPGNRAADDRTGRGDQRPRRAAGPDVDAHHVDARLPALPSSTVPTTRPAVPATTRTTRLRPPRRRPPPWSAATAATRPAVPSAGNPDRAEPAAHGHPDPQPDRAPGGAGGDVQGRRLRPGRESADGRPGDEHDHVDGTPIAGVTAHVDCTEQCGPWTTPPPVPINQELPFKHVYVSPGTYTVKFPFRALGDCAYFSSEGHGHGDHRGHRLTPLGTAGIGRATGGGAGGQIVERGGLS